MTLRTKKQGLEAGSTRTVQRIPLPHNSVFILGLATNQKWLHGIRADKRIPTVKTPEETAYNGERISLTFRYIGTFTDGTRTRIWGQGARSKNKASAGLVSNDEKEMKEMILAFGHENQRPQFDWDTEYGTGFNTLHLDQKQLA